MNANENAVLAAIALRQTINIVELMSLAQGVSDADVEHTVAQLADKKLVSIGGEGMDQTVSMTSHGYRYHQAQLAVSV